MTLLAAVDADSVIAVLPTVLIVLGCTVLALLFARDR
ncbi:MAG: hypothetical protein QOE59_2683 [Actinomycetota bacterium]|nr:hypothetical protein [Actinomycetota bacterium]